MDHLNLSIIFHKVFRRFFFQLSRRFSFIRNYFQISIIQILNGLLVNIGIA